MSHHHLDMQTWANTNTTPRTKSGRCRNSSPPPSTASTMRKHAMSAADAGATATKKPNDGYKWWNWWSNRWKEGRKERNKGREDTNKEDEGTQASALLHHPFPCWPWTLLPHPLLTPSLASLLLANPVPCFPVASWPLPLLPCPLLIYSIGKPQLLELVKMRLPAHQLTSHHEFFFSFFFWKTTILFFTGLSKCSLIVGSLLLHPNAHTP